MRNKRQHYIPATYLRAWCDNTAPANYKPYVWLFPKNGEKAIKKAPEKLFWEKDFYTISIDGERDLSIELKLSQLESQFTAIRKNTLSKGKILSSMEHSTLCYFVAAMFARTKNQRDFIQSQWNEVLEMHNKITKWAENATAEGLQSMNSMPKSEKKLSYDDIKKLTENPMPSYLPNVMSIVPQALFNMRYAIITTSNPSTFITSDTPCAWCDPAIFENPKPYGAGGLISPSIEISMPLSPTQYILFGKKILFKSVYININSDHSLVTLMNKRTLDNSTEYYISNQNNFSFTNT